MKKAFTMIELIFVIVVLGILATVAIPRLVGTREDAINTKLRADVSAIQSGIALKRSEDMMKGIMSWPQKLGTKENPFGKVLQSPLKGKWSTENGEDYEFEFTSSKKYKFKYYKEAKKDTNGNVINAGTFTCADNNAGCERAIGLK